MQIKLCGIIKICIVNINILYICLKKFTSLSDYYHQYILFATAQSRNHALYHQFTTVYDKIFYNVWENDFLNLKVLFFLQILIKTRRIFI